MTFCSCAALIHAKARRIAANIAKLPELLRKLTELRAHVSLKL
jgi:hypothetical protein